MTETRTVAVLGTGIMGAAMARNIARAGHGLRVWNRSQGKAEPLAADGAHVAGTPAEAVALAEGLGVGPEGFLDLVAGGPLDMPYLRLKAGMIMEDRLTPASFAAETAAKDARLIVEAGERHGVRLDVAAASAERFRRVVERGRGRQDMAAAYWASFDEDGTDGDRTGASDGGAPVRGHASPAPGRGQGPEGQAS